MKKLFVFIIFGFTLSIWPGLSCMAKEPIKIAAIFAKTGIAAGVVEEYNLVSIAVDEINKKGGVLGRKIEVIEFDNKSTAIGTKQAALEAVKLNVTAVIGAVWSSHSLAMAPTLQKAGIPMITPNSTNPKVTLIGDYIFRTCFIDPFQGKVMATFARQEIGAKTSVILTNINSDFSIGLSESFKKTALEKGLQILSEEKYLEKAADFTDIIQKVKALKPEVIFLPGYSRDSSLIIKQARKMGIRSIFLGGDAWNDTMFEYAGKSVEGSYFSGCWHMNVSFPKGKQLRNTYMKKYGKEKMGLYLPLVYDAVMVLADAIERAGSLDRKKIRDALASTKDFECATGTITFDENGDPMNKDAVILKLDKGSIAFVKSIKP